MGFEIGFGAFSYPEISILTSVAAMVIWFYPLFAVN